MPRDAEQAQGVAVNEILCNLTSGGDLDSLLLETIIFTIQSHDERPLSKSHQRSSIWDLKVARSMIQLRILVERQGEPGSPETRLPLCFPQCLRRHPNDTLASLIVSL